MAQKKILYVATVVKTHIMTFHVPYIKMMHECGWYTAVAAKNDYKDPAELSIPSCDAYYDIPFERNPMKKENIKAFKMLKKLIDEGDYDIIHCHTPVGALLSRLAAIAARRKGTKVIYTAHGFHFFKGAPLKNWLLYFTAEWICSFMTDVLITINGEDYAFAKKHLCAKKILYVPGVGVDLERFSGKTERRNELRSELNVEDDDFLLLSVAELSRNKNQAMILDALALLNNPHIRFVSAGRGDCIAELLKQRKQLGLEKTVSFLGYRSDANELYGAADAFIFPSFREGLSLALMEAMASGLPSIVGAIRGNTDLISDGIEGIYSPLTPQGLAESIQRLYDDPELRRSLSSAARKKVLNFGLQPVLEQVRNIYMEASKD